MRVAILAARNNTAFMPHPENSPMAQEAGTADECVHKADAMRSAGGCMTIGHMRVSV